MNYHLHFRTDRQPVETCVIGTGGFGRSFLAQGLRVPMMNVRAGVDTSAQRVAEAMRAVGIPAGKIRICASAEEAGAAWQAGDYIAAEDVAHLLDLPLEVFVEATGHPEAGARHARLAIEAGRHVALVSKEVDSVVGPGLAALAERKGCVVTPVDGDQPSLLIDLITWAETLGFEIVAAGKSSEYDFVYDAAAGTLASNGRTVEAPEFGRWSELGLRDVAEVVAGRAAAAAMLPQRAVPDLCELSVVANATGYGVDAPALHAPIARITEVPSILCERAKGGVMGATGKLDVFHCLRAPGEVSFAGGVFVILRCNDAETWDMLKEKGHVVARTGDVAMIFNPRHLLGLEAATSILEAGLIGRGTGGVEPAHHVDLVAFANRDLAAGEVLAMGGHHHSIDGVDAHLIPASALSDESPAPFYLASNQRLRRPVAAGSYIRMGDLDHRTNSELMALRAIQDGHFHRR
ncbi:SAF domain-containing protein [Paracoccus sp. AS002]|uniref:NAD(P)H-dependent oxidoreductase n=1 Tax=Paracoccus sp. AS002 TaxID=3019545 RepID=UPI000916529C|nr:SAF domain-containing protein [Paracoccus sp. AS002]MDF3904364.1 flagellar biosynthesis protein FlgA [Paracoccus sp. AS002]SFX67761.1 Predicted homoserine dehydrogenase, contains C-terminal SAF domain [Paracoccus pantotrophus]